MSVTMTLTTTGSKDEAVSCEDEAVSRVDTKSRRDDLMVTLLHARRPPHVVLYVSPMYIPLKRKKLGTGINLGSELGACVARGNKSQLIYWTKS